MAASAVAIFGPGAWWIGAWPAASAVAQRSAIFLGPAMAASAAWGAARLVRRGMSERLAAAAQPDWRVHGARLAATMSYGLAVYLLGVAVVAAVTSPSSGGGFLWPSYLLLGASVIVACAGLGYAVGTSTRSRIAGPVICGLACFVFLAYPAAGLSSCPGCSYSTGALNDMTFAVWNGPVYMALSGSALAVRFAIAVALVAVAVLWPWRRSHWRRAASRKAAALVAVAAVVALAATLGVAGPVSVARAAAGPPECTASRVRICLWPEDGKYLPELTGLSRRLAALPGGLTVPSTFYEQGLTRGRAARPGGALGTTFPAMDGGGELPVVASDIASDILNATIPPPVNCPPPPAAAVMPLNVSLGNLINWLTLRLLGQRPARALPQPGGSRATVARVLAESAAAQARWASHQEHLIRKLSCG